METAVIILIIILIIGIGVGVKYIIRSYKNMKDGAHDYYEPPYRDFELEYYEKQLERQEKKTVEENEDYPHGRGERPMF